MDLRRSVVEKKLTGRSKAASKASSKNASRATSNYGTDDEDETDFDNLSVASLDSNDSFLEANLESNWEQAFDECVEAILERKGSSVQSREESLARLIRFMSLRVTVREIGSRDTNLANAIAKMLKNSRSEKEALLCTKALAILYITCPDNDDIYAIANPALKNALNLSFLVAKAAALVSLATITLIFQSAPPAQALIEHMIEIIENDGNTIDAQDDALVVSSAEGALAIAMTILEGADPMEDIQLAAPCLIEQLESVDPRVRAAAGEALALFFEMTAVDPDDEEALAAYHENPPVDDVHHLTKLLTDLATTSSKKQSKHSRKEQHQTFREVLATVTAPASQAAPAESVRFGKSLRPLYVTNWTQILRLDHFRRVLGSGLQVHLRKNAVVRHLLDYAGPPPPNSDDESEPDDDISKDLKNSINQEMKKQRHRDRNHDRKEKSAMSSSFLAEDASV